MDDLITVSDSLNQKATVKVITIKGNGCEITPITRYLTKGEITIFYLIGDGCLSPFSATIISGEADVEQNENEFKIKASNIDETVKIKFSDSANHELVSEMKVIGKLTCSTQNIYLENLENVRNFSVSNGVVPYTVTTTIGEVEIIDNKIIFTPPTRYKDGNITVISADGQQCSVNVEKAVLKPIISPSYTKIALNDLKKFTATLGTQIYSWSVEKGTIEELSDNSILYTAPKYETTDKITVIDDSGQKAISTIQVCEDISNCENSLVYIKLTKGWNLIAIPTDVKLVEIESDSIPMIGTRDIKEIGNYKNIWSFENKTWINPTTLTPKVGYWINSLEENEIYFDEDSYNINMEVLSEGWHLLGNGKDISNLHTNSNIKATYIYDNLLGKWNKNPILIKAGEGFWIQK